jgi:hypothetical protein
LTFIHLLGGREKEREREESISLSRVHCPSTFSNFAGRLAAQLGTYNAAWHFTTKLHFFARIEHEKFWLSGTLCRDAKNASANVSVKPNHRTFTSNWVEAFYRRHSAPNLISSLASQLISTAAASVSYAYRVQWTGVLLGLNHPNALLLPQ